MIWTLQVLVSLIFFVNKLFLLSERKLGWLLGAVAATLAILYFYLIGLPIYTVLEASLVILMAYGFLKKETENPRVEFVIRLVVIVAMFLLAIFAFNGLITIIELPSALSMLWGTYLLTHNKMRRGWIFYGVAHLLAAILGYQKEQLFFADFQVASAIVCFVGATKKSGVMTKAVTS